MVLKGKEIILNKGEEGLRYGFGDYLLLKVVREEVKGKG